MFDYEEKLDNEGLKKVLKEEKKNLLEVTHWIFWNSLFIDAYKYPTSPVSILSTLFSFGVLIDNPTTS